MQPAKNVAATFSLAPLQRCDDMSGASGISNSSVAQSIDDHC
jgi:hypothetical protein